MPWWLAPPPARVLECVNNKFKLYVSDSMAKKQTGQARFFFAVLTFCHTWTILLGVSTVRTLLVMLVVFCRT